MIDPKNPKPSPKPAEEFKRFDAVVEALFQTPIEEVRELEKQRQQEKSQKPEEPKEDEAF